MLFLVDHILGQFEKNLQLVNFINKHLSWAFFKSSLAGDEGSAPSQAFLEFHRLLDSSGLTFSNPEIMMYMILEFVSGISYNSILYHQPAGLEELRPHMHDVIRYIIRREQIPGPISE